MEMERSQIAGDSDMIIVDRQHIKADVRRFDAMGIAAMGGSAAVEAGTETEAQPGENTSEGAEIPQKAGKEEGRHPLSWMKEMVIALVLAILIMQFFRPTIVQQRSMEPNFHPGDYVVVSKQAYRLFKATPVMGDVIVFHSELETEDGKEKLLIKRVIGLPGDVITISEGNVYVNGDMIDDSYTKDAYTSGSIENYVVPEEHVFCMGDNRSISVDSRSSKVGVISYDDIMGKVIFRLLPIADFGTIMNPYK